MTVTTPEDVEAVLVRPLADSEVTAIARLLELVEADVLDRLPGYSLTPGTETVTLPGPWDDELWLPRYPVTAVTAVTVAGAAVDATTYRFTGQGGLRRLYPLVGPWPLAAAAAGDVTVAYAYGAPDGPLVLQIASTVAAALTGASANPGGLTAMAIGTYREDYAARSPDGLRVSDDVLRRYRRHAVATVRIR